MGYYVVVVDVVVVGVDVLVVVLVDVVSRGGSCVVMGGRCGGNQWVAWPTRQGCGEASPGNDPGASMRDAPKVKGPTETNGWHGQKGKARRPPQDNAQAPA